MFSTHSLNNKKIAVIGLGYVGLPLAVEFAKNRDVVGFDVNASRIEALRGATSHESTLEVSDKEIDRDRGTPRDATPPTPPGIRVPYHGGSTELGLGGRPDLGKTERLEIGVA